MGVIDYIMEVEKSFIYLFQKCESLKNKYKFLNVEFGYCSWACVNERKPCRREGRYLKEFYSC